MNKNRKAPIIDLSKIDVALDLARWTISRPGQLVSLLARGRGGYALAAPGHRQMFRRRYPNGGAGFPRSIH